MELSDAVKEKVREHLSNMNKTLGAARQAIKDGDFAKALEQLQEAVEAKHLAISTLPELPLAPKLTVPFFPIYDVFSEIDRLVNELYIAVLAAKKQLPKEGVLDPSAYLGKLSELIEELMRNLILKYKDVDSAALDIINELIDALTKIRKKVRDKDFKDIEIFADPLFDDPRSIKLKFLELVGKDIHLDDLYTRFYNLDTDILSLVREMTGAKPDEEKRKRWIKLIEDIEKRKGELEKLFQK